MCPGRRTFGAEIGRVLDKADELVNVKKAPFFAVLKAGNKPRASQGRGGGGMG